MKTNLFKLLFPKKYKESERMKDEIELLKMEIDFLQEAEDAKPTMADLMKDTLKLLKLDLDKAEVPDFLEGLDEGERLAKLSLAHDIWQNQAFHDIFKYLANKQGNYTLREATNDVEIYAGRMSIWGLTLFKGCVQKYSSLFVEETTHDEFDRHEVV